MPKAIKKAGSKPSNKLDKLAKDIALLNKKLSDPKTPSSSVNGLRSQISTKKKALKELEGSGSGSMVRPPNYAMIHHMSERLRDKPAKRKQQIENPLPSDGNLKKNRGGVRKKYGI